MKHDLLVVAANCHRMSFCGRNASVIFPGTQPVFFYCIITKVI